jgi:ubiquinone/menaquinone biosynthesis C-methylase UbiE
MKKKTLKRNIAKAVRILLKDNSSKDLYIFGTGAYADQVIEALREKKIEPAGFFDNSPGKIGIKKQGKEIKKPVLLENSRVLLASLWQDEMFHQLIRLGYSNLDIFTLEQGRHVLFNVNKKVSYMNFGYIPTGRFFHDLKGKLIGTENLLKRLQARDILRTLDLKPDESILDFGCGGGYITIELAKQARLAYGIDISPGLKGKKIPAFLAHKLKYLSVNGKSLPFEDNFFDVVLASEVLPMIENPALFLKEIRRVLKPGGRLVMVNGIGRRFIQEAYRQKSRKLALLKQKYPQRFPGSFEEFELKLQQIFGTSIKGFMTSEEIFRLLKENEFHIQEVVESPSHYFGSNFEWGQFKRYIKNKNIFKTNFFYLYYVFYTVARWFSDKTYPGGLICRAYKVGSDDDETDGIKSNRIEEKINFKEKYHSAPYGLEIYSRLLQSIKDDSGCSIKTMIHDHPEDNKINIFLRHDVDFERDVLNLKLLTDIEKKLGVRSSVYIRCDFLDYEPEKLKPVVTELRNEGVEVGLHTSCYFEDDYLEAFRRETSAFVRIFGFQPASFTVHGMGQFRMDTRRKFLKQIKTRMEEYNYRFYDSFHLSYDYVIEDCHGGPEVHQRYILKDFKEGPGSYLKGKSYLILTHPGYWTEPGSN